ncbi:MAG: hypothetical protein AAF587_29660 [Bacteroidota bacterium]
MDFDLKLDDSDELAIEGGDFVIVESGQQHIRSIVQAHKGEFKQFPLLGVGISQFLNGPIDLAKIRLEVIRNLRQDEFKQIKTKIEDGELSIIGNRNG